MVRGEGGGRRAEWVGGESGGKAVAWIWWRTPEEWAGVLVDWVSSYSRLLFRICLGIECLLTT